MATYSIYRETALPSELQPNSIYLIAPTTTTKYVEVYVTGLTKEVVRRTIKESDVQLMIDASITNSGGNNLIIVANITERDALTLTDNTFCYVQDATGDVTVASGAALYLWDKTAQQWLKVAEYESMDVVLDWNKIQNKPTSSVAEIDDAVSKKHTHSNKTQLDKITEDAQGNILYGGNRPTIEWTSTTW